MIPEPFPVGVSASAQEIALTAVSKNRIYRELLDQTYMSFNHDMSVKRFLEAVLSLSRNLKDLIDQVQSGNVYGQEVRVKLYSIGRNYADDHRIQSFTASYVNSERATRVGLGSVYLLDGMRVVPMIEGKNLIIPMARAKWVSDTELEVVALRIHLEVPIAGDVLVSAQALEQTASSIRVCGEGMEKSFSMSNASFEGFEVQPGIALRADVSMQFEISLREAMTKQVLKDESADVAMFTCENAIRRAQLNGSVMLFLAGQRTKMLDQFMYK